MSGEVGVVPSPFELEGGNIGRKAGNDASHLPWPQTGSGCPDGTAFDSAIMLSESSGWVWRRANVVTGFSDCRSQQVAAIEGGYWFHLHRNHLTPISSLDVSDLPYNELMSFSPICC